MATCGLAEDLDDRDTVRGWGGVGCGGGVGGMGWGRVRWGGMGVGWEAEVRVEKETPQDPDAREALKFKPVHKKRILHLGHCSIT